MFVFLFLWSFIYREYNPSRQLLCCPASHSGLSYTNHYPFPVLQFSVYAFVTWSKSKDRSSFLLSRWPSFTCFFWPHIWRSWWEKCPSVWLLFQCLASVSTQDINFRSGQHEFHMQTEPSLYKDINHCRLNACLKWLTLDLLGCIGLSVLLTDVRYLLFALFSCIPLSTFL